MNHKNIKKLPNVKYKPNKLNAKIIKNGCFSILQKD